jgi:hypothetical protein
MWPVQEERVLESATVVAWGYVAEMRQLALAHAARPDDFPDDADDDPSPGPDPGGPGPDPAPTLEAAVAVDEIGARGPCAACLRAEVDKQRRGGRSDETARRSALSRCFGRGHLLVQRTGAPPQVHGPARGEPRGGPRCIRLG